VPWSLTGAEQGNRSVLDQLMDLASHPARVSMPDLRAPEGSVKIPGTIREVRPASIVVDLFFALTAPRVNQPAVLEIMTHDALLQCLTVIQSASNPQCLHLTIPERIHPIQRRRHPRAKVSVSASLAPVGGVGGISVTVINISAGGCAMLLPEPVLPGSLVHLDLEAAGLDHTAVSAQVIRCSLSSASGGLWEAGCSFYDLTAEQHEHLIQYVKLYE
jgi:hypothetical protein